MLYFNIYLKRPGRLQLLHPIDLQLRCTNILQNYQVHDFNCNKTMKVYH